MPSGARMSRSGVIASSRVQKAYFADDFNRADSTNLGANWTEFSGTGMAINTNRLQAVGSQSFATWNTDCQTDDQFTQVTIGPGRNGTIFLLVRNPAGWPMVYSTFAPSTGAWAILTDPSSAAGNHTTRVSGSVGSTAMATGLPVRMQAVGDTYTLLLDGAPIPSATWTDTGGAVVAPGPTKRKVGLQLVGGGTINVDDWSGGDL